MKLSRWFWGSFRVGNRRIKVKILSLFFLSLLVLISCKNVTLTPPKTESPPLKVAYNAWPGFLPVALAQEKGFFAQQGVKVETFYSEDTMAQMADFGAGNYDGVTLAMGSIGIVSGKNPDVQIIFATDRSAGADAIVAQSNITSVADLKGKTIGTGLGGFGELFVATMLEKNGLTTDDVTLINVDGDKIPAQIKSGEIQAGQTWEPYVSQVVKSGGRTLFTSDKTPGLIPDVMAFRGIVVRERPEDVRAFARAWFQAVDYWKANLKEGNELIAKVLKISPETISLEGVELLNLNDNLKTFTPGNTTDSLYHTAQLYSNFYIRTGGIARPLEINKLLNAAFLKALQKG
ncbi:ABC transporter substrate-binding protein [Microcoleus sp. FACHB-672]|uniref:ABC transporter substrate-binding protein n=1 Tax=Microcoleus sp. FACHB-672 TaxID=2692825 RepID=UPI001F54D719|nr:ABC transporter substrate-binding protein [Microcoleus sp. FACHB-672]